MIYTTTPKERIGAAMTTRRMKINGIQDEINRKNPYNIRLHGTNVEFNLKKKDSYGCVKFANHDIIKITDYLTEESKIISYLMKMV